MKKTLSFLLTLVMCVSIMPTIASASSETGRMQDEYDPETGYTTITTDDYIAVVPKGGIAEYSSDNKNLCADEVLKTTTYSNEDSIVPFDYQATVREMYEYVLKTNADMDPSSAMEIAQKLAANIEAARNASIYGNMRDISNGCNYYLLKRGSSSTSWTYEPLSSSTVSVANYNTTVKELVICVVNTSGSTKTNISYTITVTP